MSKILICNECGVEFPANGANRKYCSEKCRDIGQRKPNYIAICANCEQEFSKRIKSNSSWRPKFCSNKCANSSKEKIESTIRHNKDLKQRKKRSDGLKKKWKDILYHDTIKNCTANQWKDPITRKMMSEGISAAHRKLWKDPVHRDKMAKSGFVPSDGFYSSLHKAIVKFIKSFYTGKVLINDRIQLNFKELDIWLPELNLAFEINGTYFHADPRFYKADAEIILRSGTFLAGQLWEKDKDKAELAKSKNIKLYSIWQHDWYSDQENTKNFIRSLVRMP